MQTKQLGSQGLTASAIGLGCMGMSEFYGARNDEESIKTLRHAIDTGVTFWDTADVYGPFTNEELVGKALKGNRQKITLATKFGILRDPANPHLRGFNGSSEHSVHRCLRRDRKPCPARVASRDPAARIDTAVVRPRNEREKWCCRLPARG